MRKRIVPSAATVAEVIPKIFLEQMSTPRHLPAKESFWLARRQNRYVYKAETSTGGNSCKVKG